jgi:hypothetical protein
MLKIQDDRGREHVVVPVLACHSRSLMTIQSVVTRARP